MKNRDNMRGKRLAVLGCGESGVGAAVLGMSLGMDVLVSDSGRPAAKYIDALDSRNIRHEEGGHSEDWILEADFVVKSPGIPPYAPLVKKCFDRQIPVISEIEFAGWFTDARMVCITGSNGKTTTTLLTYHIFRNAGLDVGLAGNVGKSLALQVAEDPHEVYVIELSSFQLENMYEFKANVAVILNITPDHMDRYDHKMELYTAAKFRILQNQTSSDCFIYWMDDPIVVQQVKAVQSEALRLPFSEHWQEGAAAWTDDRGVVHFDTPDSVWEIPRDRLSLTGLHNLYNSMAAGLSASMLHLKKEDIKKSLEDFEAVEHRLEYAGMFNGARYINDSKATNVNSTWYALESMNTPVVLILGGKDKGNDYTEIESLVLQKVKGIVAMGVDNSKILEFFGEKVPVADTHSLQEAMAACVDMAAEGDTVLLSPCCASFDLFNSYEDRGNQFKAAVKALENKNF